tara:strand:- start:4269 stop:5339 length:1071 start_codon:yes stop_codon:yes gene_type:complete
MNDIKNDISSIYYGNKSYLKLNEYLKKTNYSSVFIIVDTNTQKHCLKYFIDKLEVTQKTEIISIDPGEINKNIKTCLYIWKKMSILNSDRNSLLINLGGGVITDLGGFVASTFKRSIDFINIPTSLLAMVDASIGGKTGVDLDGLKNQIGIIQHPKMILIDSYYLNSLPVNEYKNGYAEMLKHGLICDKKYWDEISNFNNKGSHNISTYIRTSVKIKHKIVLKDPYEKSIRKILNYGHTLGHAIESFCLTDSEIKVLSHGESIAIGMILESFISNKLCGLPENQLNNIKEKFNSIYPIVSFSKNNIDSIIKLLIHDKKNTHGKINFVLLKKIEAPIIDVEVDIKLIKESFDYYLKS